jgi:hypothetical protein
MGIQGTRRKYRYLLPKMGGQSLGKQRGVAFGSTHDFVTVSLAHNCNIAARHSDPLAMNPTTDSISANLRKRAFG